MRQQKGEFGACPDQKFWAKYRSQGDFVLRFFLIMAALAGSAVGCGSLSSNPDQLFQSAAQPTAEDLIEMNDPHLAHLESDDPLSEDQAAFELKQVKVLIATKEAQISHFRMMDDHLWKPQMDVLRQELTHLRRQKLSLEMEIQKATR